MGEGIPRRGGDGVGIDGALELQAVVGMVGRRGCSGCGSVLVDESCGGGVSSDRLAWTDRGDDAVVAGCPLAQRPVQR